MEKIESVLISIKPQWCELIANGKKTIEIRKTKPKIDLPFKCYIYCTKRPYLNSKNGVCYIEKEDILGGKGAGIYRRLSGTVIGEFVCDKIDKFTAEFTKDCYEDIRLNTYDEDLEESIQELITGNEYKNPSDCWLCDKSKVSYDEIRKYIYKHKDGFYNFYGWHISDLKVYDKPKELREFRKPCISPEYPYCPHCKVGYESVSESEEDAYRAFGECNTEWCCLNYVTKPPQSWCYVENI